MRNENTTVLCCDRYQTYTNIYISSAALTSLKFKILKDLQMNDKLMYNPNDDKQNINY